MICKPYWEQIPCSQECASKISSHLTTSRLEEHIWLDALSLRLYMPTEPNQWLTEIWLWQETTAWRQETKELHKPTLFITSATDRQSDRCGWNHCLLKTKKLELHRHIQPWYCYNIIDNKYLFVCLFLSRLSFFAEFTVFERGQTSWFITLSSCSLCSHTGTDPGMMFGLSLFSYSI